MPAFVLVTPVRLFAAEEVPVLTNLTLPGEALAGELRAGEPLAPTPTDAFDTVNLGGDALDKGRCESGREEG